MIGRCENRGGGLVQCCRRAGHEGSHMYRCASRDCPGMPWLASNTPHPTSCRIPELQSESERFAVAALQRDEPAP